MQKNPNIFCNSTGTGTCAGKPQQTLKWSTNVSLLNTEVKFVSWSIIKLAVVTINSSYASFISWETIKELRLLPIQIHRSDQTYQISNSSTDAGELS